MPRSVPFIGILVLFSAAFPQDSLNIRRIAEISLAHGYVNCVAAQRNYVFAGTGGDSTVEGLWVVDVSNPVHPDGAAFDTVSELWSALGIALTDSLAVIASGAGQVDLYDIRDPLAPRHLSNVGEGDGLVWDVAVQGVYVYAARYSPRGMSVSNIADPVHPFVEGLTDIADNPSGVCVSGDYAYVAAENGVHVVDVANPALPEAIAFVPDTGAMHVAVWDHHAYVTNYGGELAVVDLSNPRAPVLVASVLTHGYSDGIAAADDHVFVAAAEGGLQIYDVSDPASPVQRGFYRCAVWPSKVVVSGRYAYATSDRHLEIYDCSAALSMKDPFILHPSSFILSCAPNPFNPSTTISFSLPRASEVKLKVFDVTGRLVQTLANGRMQAGEQRLSFDGTALATGFYLVRLQAGGVSQTHTLMLVR